MAPLKPANDTETDADAALAASPFELIRPADWSTPVIFASPHSGAHYPTGFRAAARLDPLSLRRSEDAFVDEIYASAPRLGAPLLKALFPRAFVDPNREQWELDPGMFDGPLPDYVNTESPRVKGGLGTVARVVTNGEDIYRAPLSFETVRQRIETFYVPYHAMLIKLVDEAIERFGACLLIDCHSMPSIGGPMDRDPGFKRVDMVLGDCHGTSCAPAVTDLVQNALESQGYAVTRNSPYAGGYTTHHWGRPSQGIHALQIEINRALYMDELRIERGPGLAELSAKMEAVIAAITDIDPKTLGGAPA
jgi:N-formylglutamate amidohydrolase